MGRAERIGQIVCPPWQTNGAPDRGLNAVKNRLSRHGVYGASEAAF
jgi:hypothetical protein